MTEKLMHFPVRLRFFRDAVNIYGEKGLSQASPLAVGFDLRACLLGETQLLIPAGERRNVPVGIGIEPEIPGVAAFVYSRSGLGAKVGLTVAQGVGLIDPDYRGEITIFLLNTSPKDQLVTLGDRIAQLVFQPYFTPNFDKVESLSPSQRGENGYGHTGVK